jgi:2-amino-4-hydroxy-6-hydroxymethyldihydropteridine diphosphokinase
MKNGVSVIIALGSNLGHKTLAPEAILESGLSALCRCAISQVNRSSWWQSLAWPDPAQPPFLNGVVMGLTQLGPEPLMALLLDIEAEFGRERSLVNAARPLDLDLIAYGDLVSQSPDLTLPHPRAAERCFVMGPLAEIAPDWVHPVLGQTAETLYAQANIGRDARPIVFRPKI